MALANANIICDALYSPAIISLNDIIIALMEPCTRVPVGGKAAKEQKRKQKEQLGPPRTQEEEDDLDRQLLEEAAVVAGQGQDDKVQSFQAPALREAAKPPPASPSCGHGGSNLPYDRTWGY